MKNPRNTIALNAIRSICMSFLIAGISVYTYIEGKSLKMHLNPVIFVWLIALLEYLISKHIGRFNKMGWVLRLMLIFITIGTVYLQTLFFDIQRIVLLMLVCITPIGYFVGVMMYAINKMVRMDEKFMDHQLREYDPNHVDDFNH